MKHPFMQPFVFRRLMRAGRQLMTQTTPYASHPDRIDAGNAVSLHPSVRLTVLDADQAPQGRIVLGANVYLGRYVELTAAGGGSVIIGENTSLQDGDIIYGDVRIGSHCLLGRHVFIASRGHNFRRHPAWLIRDQDAAMLSGTPYAGPRTVIEDDCWIGQGVVITPGVYIGRGAVIGANSVVTNDVAPYEVHGCVPNRKIGARFPFLPPARIRATEDDDLPYFYRGFAVSRAHLAISRARGVIAMESRTCLMLAGTQGGKLHVHGQCLDADGALRLWINGIEQPRHLSSLGQFVIQADIPGIADDRPTPLLGYTIVEMETDGRHAIASAEILTLGE